MGECRAGHRLDSAEHLCRAVRLHHLARFCRRALAQGRPRHAARMGPRRQALRYGHHLVPDRRRSLYGLYLHRRSGARFRRRRDGVLRRALHDHHLSDPVPGVSAALARLHKHNYITPADFVRGRFGNRWLALAVALTGIVATMPYIALQLVGLQVVIGAHGHLRHRLCRRPAAGHRLRDPRGLHLFQRAACARLDRNRQGHPDLYHGVRRGDRGADPARRLRQDLCRGAAGEIAAGHARPPIPPAPTAITRRWRSARRWRCFSIRIRSPAF